MLSGETSVGEYPVVTVQTMARIVASTEDHGLERIAPLTNKPRTQGGAITLAAIEVAEFVEAKFLCIFTESGDSARRMSRLRSKIPMLAFTPEPGIRRRLALTWGIQTYLVDRVTHTDAMFGQVDDILLTQSLAELGDTVVVISGSPPGIAGSTNDIRVHRVGDAHNEVHPAYAKN
jgi:pyruvate kinase